MAIAGVVLASFAAPAAASAGTGTVTVSKTGAAQGSRVTSSPAGIDCGATCSAQFDSTTFVALHAVPAAGTTLSWSCLGATSSDGSTCTTGVPDGGTITQTANFSAAGGAQPIDFHVVDQSGRDQRAYVTEYPNSETDATGHLTVWVTPGETIHFTRNLHVGSPASSIAPPEGAGGLAYTAPGTVPASATITLPDVHTAFHPELSPAEEWIVGELNQARAGFGSPALKVSATLSRAADAMARDEAVFGRFPDPQFWVTLQDSGWPGDPYYDGFVMADAISTDATAVLPHWNGTNPNDPESTPIWNELKQPYLTVVGIGDGNGAWIIYLADHCPDSTAAGATACAIGTDTGDVNADPSGPAITITSPGNGAHYAQGASVAAAYGCDGTAVSCVGPVGSGAAIDTSSPGTRTFTVRATGGNGNNSAASVTYTVDAPSTATAGTSGTSAPVPPHKKKKKKKHHHHH